MGEILTINAFYYLFLKHTPPLFAVFVLFLGLKGTKNSLFLIQNKEKQGGCAFKTP